jgi:DNA processing protein
MAERLGRDLAARGLIILSGMARGIDAIGHRGALASNGRAIGVLGTGIDVCYPERKQKALRKSFGAGRYPERVPPRSASCARELPHQESIVAGLPLGVIVIEGAEFSASLITARLAMEFGREVFGVPGNVTQAVSYAPNMLIKLGAKLVVDAEDVIEELPTAVRAALGKGRAPRSRAT